MPVRHEESFSFELPLTAITPGDDTVLVTMGRSELAALYRDCRDALGIKADTRVFVEQPYPDADDLNLAVGEEVEANGKRLQVTAMSADEAAARAQVLARMAEAEANRELIRRPHAHIGSGQ
jgi:hypothetical protein